MLIITFYVSLEPYQFNNETKRSKLVFSSLLLLSIGAAFFTSASKTSIVSESHARANSSNLSGLEHSLLPYTRSNRRGGEVRFPREERRAAPSSPLLARFGEVWRGYLRKSSPFTSFLLTFGKLTHKVWIAFPISESRKPAPVPWLLTGKQSLHVFLTYVR